MHLTGAELLCQEDLWVLLELLLLTVGLNDIAFLYFLKCSLKVQVKPESSVNRRAASWILVLQVVQRQLQKVGPGGGSS